VCLNKEETPNRAEKAFPKKTKRFAFATLRKENKPCPKTLYSDSPYLQMKWAYELHWECSRLDSRKIVDIPCFVNSSELMDGLLNVIFSERYILFLTKE
jgi:hypothetical protein